MFPISLNGQSAEPLRDDVRHFVDCIVEKRESDVAVTDGKAILEALFACYRSASTGDVVEL